MFQDNAPDVFQGRRSHLKYASPNSWIGFFELNQKGPEPFDYLEYAKADIRSETQHGALNSVGNAKKAIHLIIDRFLEIFGLDAYSKTNFPTKLGIIKQLNAFPTRMITILNHTRNIVEHEFSDVDISTATDFVDIAEMFLMIVYPYLRHATVGSLVGIEGDDRCFEWSIHKAKVQVFEIIMSDLIDSPFGRIPFAFSLEQENLKLIESINITRSNVDKWINHVDFFVYCTKRDAVRQPNIKIESKYEEESDAFKLLNKAFDAAIKNNISE